MSTSEYTPGDVVNFWKYVAGLGDYSDKRHSTDFPEEIPTVQSVISRQPSWGHLVSWGSADGRREPAGILENLANADRKFSVYCVECTDLWFPQIREAMRKQLESGSCTLELYVNPSSELNAWTENRAREIAPLSLILGCYDYDQLHDPSGIRAYLASLLEGVLFDRVFRFAVASIEDGNLIIDPERVVTVNRDRLRQHMEYEIRRTHELLRQYVGEIEKSAVGVLVVAPTSHGTFQSMWFRKDKFAEYVRAARLQVNSFELKKGTKGFLFIINPKRSTNGAIVSLNNVLGCTHFEVHFATLRVMASIGRFVAQLPAATGT